MDTAGPLAETFISSVADRDKLDVIHVFYQNELGNLVHEKHTDKTPGNFAPELGATMRMRSPLGSVYTLAQSSPTPGIQVYAASPDLNDTPSVFEIFQKLPDYKPVTQACSDPESKFGAMYDGNSIYVLYQKAGEENKNKIFEKKLKTGDEKAVVNNALSGTNLSVYEPAIHPGSLSPREMAYKLKGQQRPDTDPDGTCRYMVYNGTDNHLWWVWIDYPGGPDIEKVQNIQTDEIKRNSPVAIVSLLEFFALYYIDNNNNICRILRGDYGWGAPKLVEGLTVTPRTGTKLAVSRDIKQGERVVWLSYQGKDNAITGFHDTIISPKN